MFDTTGQLSSRTSASTRAPLLGAGVRGDVIVVNGKAWPFFNVEPKRYRFIFLNGSNAAPTSCPDEQDHRPEGPRSGDRE